MEIIMHTYTYNTFQELSMAKAKDKNKSGCETRSSTFQLGYELI